MVHQDTDNPRTMSRSQISSLHVANFKSYRAATLRLSPLTVLIGPNASGKSNFIESVRLQAWLAEGNRLGEAFQVLASSNPLVRGTVPELFYNNTHAITLKAQFVDVPDNWNKFEVGLRRDDSDLRILNERITKPFTTVPLYDVVDAATGYSHDIQVAYNNFVRGGVKPRIGCTDQQLVLTQLRTPARFGHGHIQAQETIPAVCNAVADALANIKFLDPSPRLMRGYSHELDIELKEDGSNLSSVLHALHEGNKSNDILDFIRSLPEQNISSIDFVRTPRQEVMVRLKETFGGTTTDRDAPVLSDGTLRVLSIAACVLSAQPGSVVVIEEIDNGVHPSRASDLMKNLLAVAKKRRLNVLLTTHNPALLDAVPDDAVPDIACCFRDPGDGSSRIVHLADSENYLDIAAQGHLGRLMSKGVIESMLKDQRSLSARQKVAMDWLTSREHDDGD